MQFPRKIEENLYAKEVERMHYQSKSKVQFPSLAIARVCLLVSKEWVIIS